MFIAVRTFPLLFFSLLLAGCAGLPGRPGDVGVDGQACTGSVQVGATQALAEAANGALQAQAQKPAGKGGVCAAKVFSVTAPLLLYRVWDSSRPYSRLGAWWSLTKPGGSRDDYRAAYAICKEWSALDRVVACEARPGSQIVIGTTQSAQCDDGTSHGQTADLQVFVANDGRAGILHMAACGAEAAWP